MLKERKNIGAQKYTHWILLSLFALLMVGNVKAQGLDTETQTYFKELQKKYADQKGYEVDFELSMQYPEEDAQVYGGHYWSKATKYKIEMDDQLIVSDGSSQWIYNKEDKLITIYDAEDSEFTISPSGIFEILQSDQYSYALTFSGERSGTKVDEIEFKPNDQYSDFFKARLTVDHHNKALKKLETFYRDGSKMVIALTQFKSVVPEDGHFSFSPENHEGVEVEDLRW